MGSADPKPRPNQVIRSFPAAGFGKGDRGGTKHIPMVGRDSPGPAYALRASVGYQVGLTLTLTLTLTLNPTLNLTLTLTLILSLTLTPTPTLTPTLTLT